MKNQEPEITETKIVQMADELLETINSEINIALSVRKNESHHSISSDTKNKTTDSNHERTTQMLGSVKRQKEVLYPHPGKIGSHDPIRKPK